MEIYTIGYSGFEINDFINMLQTNNINSLIDVRSSPYSKIYTDYNREELQKRLKENGIVKKQLSGIKVLGNGVLEKKLTVKAHKFSMTAKEKIEAAGGKVEVI